MPTADPLNAEIELREAARRINRVITGLERVFDGGPTETVDNGTENLPTVSKLLSDANARLQLAVEPVLATSQAHRDSAAASAQQAADSATAALAAFEKGNYLIYNDRTAADSAVGVALSEGDYALVLQDQTNNSLRTLRQVQSGVLEIVFEPDRSENIRTADGTSQASRNISLAIDYLNKASSDAAIASLPEGQLFTVDIDESRDGGRHQYKTQGGGSYHYAWSADLIEFLSGHANSVSRTLRARELELAKRATDFGADATGVAVSRASIAAMFASGGRSFRFTPGTYNLGDLSGGSTLFDLSGLGGGISIFMDPGVRFVCKSISDHISDVFKLVEQSDSYIGFFELEDLGGNINIEHRGARAITLVDAGNMTWGRIRLDGVRGINLVAAVTSNGSEPVNRLSGIDIGVLWLTGCYYGLNCQNSGDCVRFALMYCDGVRRPYFSYGAQNHRGFIYNRNAGTSTGALNISRSPDGFDTKDIKIQYTHRGAPAAFGTTHVLINHIDLLGGDISNIEIDLDIESTLIYFPVRFINYTGSGGNPTSEASANTVRNVRIKGAVDGQASPIDAIASYASKGFLEIDALTGAGLDASLLNAFSWGVDSRDYPVQWTASVTNPALGNGSLVARQTRHRNRIDVSVHLTIGSTTDLGAGEWQFSLPYPAARAAAGSVYALDAGSAHYAGTVRLTNGQSIVSAYVNGSGSGFSGSSPFNWSDGDTMILSISYEI